MSPKVAFVSLGWLLGPSQVACVPLGWLVSHTVAFEPPWVIVISPQSGFCIPLGDFCPLRVAFESPQVIFGSPKVAFVPPPRWLLSPRRVVSVLLHVFAHARLPLFQNNTAKLVKQLSKSSDDEGERAPTPPKPPKTPRIPPKISPLTPSLPAELRRLASILVSDWMGVIRSQSSTQPTGEPPRCAPSSPPPPQSNTSISPFCPSFFRQNGIKRSEKRKTKAKHLSKRNLKKPKMRLKLRRCRRRSGRNPNPCGPLLPATPNSAPLVILSPSRGATTGFGAVLGFFWGGEFEGLWLLVGCCKGTH